MSIITSMNLIEFREPSSQAFEVVERKCIGHPDTLADGISEAISRDLCRLYLEETGYVQHHNVDKVLIIGGKTRPAFGGGEVLEPPTVIVGGRATALEHQSLEDVITRSASDYIYKTMSSLTDFRVEPRTRQGSPELRNLIGVGSNDTSIGVGFAPLGKVESLVLGLEKDIRRVKGAGEDIKIMAVRTNNDLRIIVAVAMISRHVASMEEYQNALASVKEIASSRTGAEVFVNTADRGDNIFLTVTGTSAEMGDDGATGRGNRGSGLITPMRPMTMEAIAGKNPVNHVGKIYNVMARLAAEDISKLDGVSETYVTLVSRIGAPLDRPFIKAVTIAGDEDRSTAIEAEAILSGWLKRGEDLLDQFIRGKLMLY